MRLVSPSQPEQQGCGPQFAGSPVKSGGLGLARRLRLVKRSELKQAQHQWNGAAQQRIRTDLVCCLHMGRNKHR